MRRFSRAFSQLTVPERTPALVGVGFIVGPSIASTVFAGAVLGWLLPNGRRPEARGIADGSVRTPIEDEQDAIETGWLLLDATYEEDAAEDLKLTEKPRADLAILGSTAALVLNKHRLARLVITLEGVSLQIERTTRNGTVFNDTTTQEDTRAAMDRLARGVAAVCGGRSHRDEGAGQRRPCPSSGVAASPAGVDASSRTATSP